MSFGVGGRVARSDPVPRRLMRLGHVDANERHSPDDMFGDVAGVLLVAHHLDDRPRVEGCGLFRHADFVLVGGFVHAPHFLSSKYSRTARLSASLVTGISRR